MPGWSQQVGETFEPVKAKGQKQSVYAVALDEAGALLATGSPAALVRINDTRSGDKVMKLRGHTDNIRRAQRQNALRRSTRYCLMLCLALHPWRG